MNRQAHPNRPADLIPATIARRIPRLGASGEAPLLEVTAQAKVVDGASSWRWYLIEWDGEDACYGLILTAGFAVAGQFTLSELAALQNPQSSIRCDTDFEPCSVSELIKTEPAVGQLVAGSGLNLVNLE